MALARFHVAYIHSGEPCAQIEMDDELLKQADILDPDTLTLRGLKNGGMYTLVPMEDPRITTLRRVRRAYLGLTARPIGHLMTTFARVDEMIDVMGLLFGEVELVKVENRDDLDRIINPPREEFEHKLVKVTILGDLLQEILKEDDEDKPAQPDSDESKPDA